MSHRVFLFACGKFCRNISLACVKLREKANFLKIYQNFAKNPLICGKNEPLRDSFFCGKVFADVSLRLLSPQEKKRVNQCFPQDPERSKGSHFSVKTEILRKKVEFSPKIRENDREDRISCFGERKIKRKTHKVFHTVFHKMWKTVEKLFGFTDEPVSITVKPRFLQKLRINDYLSLFFMDFSSSLTWRLYGGSESIRFSTVSQEESTVVWSLLKSLPMFGSDISVT